MSYEKVLDNVKNNYIQQRIEVKRDWLTRSKENSKEYKNSKYKEQPLPLTLR